ncbi:urease accessory protein UreE [Telmatospirillum siberiense]|uniref:Urease accessory protein UreE n=1 Tax=Telmatospirillum siberiense TaxID=382514 RepID=A0A2N3PTI1_9PROT|nr:urease accessory protein UreE [Telmatospirillum siberiense]PKU23708.1 Urease accessory protein UreE [Telmatospirillum siberiense]
MRRALSLHRPGDWPADRARASITLAWADRHRRRLAMTDDSGGEFLLDLPEASLLAEGCGLRLSDGEWIAVRAAPEAVVDIACHDAESLIRIAWHIGNRHAPVQILEGGGLRIQDDHVLVGMVEQLGGHIVRHRAAFHAEGGAYAAGEHHHA